VPGLSDATQASKRGEQPMRVSDLERLYDYSYWANKILLGVVSQLTPEQFTQTVAGSYGSIRNTLVHVLSAEWGWLDRCGGPKRGGRLNPEDYPTTEALVQEWTRVEDYMRAFLSSLEDEDLTREMEFALGRGQKQSVPLGDLMQHAAVHAVHHRGQVALLLRALGYVPGNFDLLLYVGDKRSVPV
jgi:uncharacterized damage-inducible protein DinB